MLGEEPQANQSKGHLYIPRFVKQPLMANTKAWEKFRNLAPSHRRHYIQWITLVNVQFRGTSYKAANWIYLGETRGRGRMDQHHEAHGCAVKRIYVYPLWRDGQHRLSQNSAPRWFPWGEA
jgi:Bacteriocin-protection, YdeI or OmpD-Associated